MVVEDGVDLKLGPREVASFRLVDNRPPKPAFQYALDHDRVVAAANIGPVRDLFRLRLHKHAVGIVDLPQEIEVPKNPLLDLLLRALLLVEPAYEGVLFVEEELVDDVVLGVDLAVGAEGGVEAVYPFPPLLLEELPLGLVFGGVLL